MEKQANSDLYIEANVCERQCGRLTIDNLTLALGIGIQVNWTESIVQTPHHILASYAFLFSLHFTLTPRSQRRPPAKQSKKSHLLRPFKHLFSRSRSSSHQGGQSVIPDNERASISALPINNTTFVPQVIPQGTEYTAILDLSTTPSAPLTCELRMKECGSTTYEGLKTAIQGIYECSGIFPPLQTTAGVLLTISKVVDVRGSRCSSVNTLIMILISHQRVSANRTDLEHLGVKLQSIDSILSIISKYRENGGLRALDYRVEKFCLYVESSFCPCLFDAPLILLRAIDLQINAVEKLHDNSLWTRTLESTKDADTVLKVFRNISSLCDIFQVSFCLDKVVRVH